MLRPLVCHMSINSGLARGDGRHWFSWVLAGSLSTARLSSVSSVLGLWLPCVKDKWGCLADQFFSCCSLF